MNEWMINDKLHMFNIMDEWMNEWLIINYMFNIMDEWMNNNKYNILLIKQ